MRSLRWLLLAFLLGVVSIPAAAQDKTPEKKGDEILRPRAADGRALNVDFETGTLADWTAEGDAFARQPIEGDTVHARRADMHSGHTGKYWIGTFEVGQDKPQGTLTSAPFKVTHPWASFRVAGGNHRETAVELLGADGKPFFFATGHESEDLEQVAVDLTKQQGQEIRIRLVDKHSGGWGHVNFDDFRFHAEKPALVRPAAPTNVSADVYAHNGLSGPEAARAMTLPAGFDARLFAGEPDVQQPIAMALDDRGRLWVAEGYSYPIRVPENQARDRILIFEDTDGDGKHDTRKVFADKLNLVSGLELGFGGVWVGSAPHLLFIPDRNGDDAPDGPAEILLDGWGYQDTHETLNTFIWGPDGWLYGCHGVFTHSRVGKPGTPDQDRLPINAGIWRYHPTRHVFEVFAHGTSNPWGVDFNDQGQAFLTACVIPHLFHVIQGGRYHRQAGAHFNPCTYDDIKTVAVHRHYVGGNPHGGNNRSDSAGGGHAHCGAMIYLGGKWPEAYRNQIFMNNIHGQRINMDALSAKGSGYEGNRAPDFLMSNDRWSQILNLRYGPDGDVYLIDWYDKQACHTGDVKAHDRSNGRIFKVVYTGADAPAWTKAALPKDLQKLPSAELVALAAHPNDYFVRHSRRILQERAARQDSAQNETAGAREALAALLKDPRENVRLRALWALHATGELSTEHVSAARKDSQPNVRAWSVQLDLDRAALAPKTKTPDGLCQEAPAETLQALTELARTDASPVVRLALASAATRLAPALRWDLAKGLLTHSEDAGDHNLPLMYWYAVEQLAPLSPEKALTLAAECKIAQVQGYLFRRLAELGSPESRNVLVAHLNQTDEVGRQRQVLEGLAAALAGRRQIEMPRGWSEAAGKLAASEDPRVRSLAGSLSVTFGDAKAFDALRKTLADPKAQLAPRQAALAALAGAKDPQLPTLLHALVGEEPLRGAALRALALYDHPKTPEIILQGYAAYSPEAKRDALATLASRAAYALPLMAALEAKTIPATDLSADLVRQLYNLKSPEVESRLKAHWGAVRDTPEDRLKMIAEYKQMILAAGPKPDVALGRAVFAKTCQQCHTLFGTGGKVGPELTGSNRANLDYLLSNVVDPSAVMAKEYIPTVLALNDGRVVTGIVKGNNNGVLTVQTANELTLIPQTDVDEMQPGTKSMMPDDILKPFKPEEIRALAAYLASPGQTPMLLSKDNAPTFFNGRDLTGWDGIAGLWSVEEGEIVGRSKGLKNNEFLISQMASGDFKLSLEVKLVKNEGNSGIQFRSEVLPHKGDGPAAHGPELKGCQADIGAGWWGKLYEENARGLLWKDSGEAHVKLGEWNTYEIEAIGPKVRTWINGQLCVDLEDAAVANRGVIAFQLHSGGPTEVRFRKLKLEPR